MSRLTKFAAWLLLPFIVACSDSDNDDNGGGADPAPAQLRVTHASPDAPAVNVYVDGELALEAVDFKQSSGLIPFADAGSVGVEVRGILPDGSEVTVIGPVDLALMSGERTDVLAFGTLFDAGGDINIAPWVLDPVEIDTDISDVRVGVAHAATGVGAVDIYVTAPGAVLSNQSPIDADFGDAAGPVAIEPDTDYRVRITPDGTTDVVFDSGVLNFPAGTELLLVAVDNTFKVGDSPVSVLAVGPDGASEVLDANTGGSVRVVHNSADTPPVDVLVNGAEVLDAVPFTAASDYGDIEAPPGTYNVVVAADADNTIAPIDIELTLEPAGSYTAVAIGSFADSTVEALLTEDDRRNIATAAVLEVIHGSYQVAADIPVDVYLTADGVIADAEPAITDLAYSETTDQLQVAPGDYWITVTAAGDKSVVAFDSGGTLSLKGGTNYTVIARDPSADEVSGKPLIDLILLTD